MSCHYVVGFDRNRKIPFDALQDVFKAEFKSATLRVDTGTGTNAFFRYDGCDVMPQDHKAKIEKLGGVVTSGPFVKEHF